MSKVEVLCPNGRRVNVNVSPNTKLLKILDEACLKQGFTALDYELRHGRKVLDISLSIQLAALPNLAKLELVKAAKPRSESAVTVALQTSEGKRLQREFSPTTTLFDVLSNFEENDGMGGKAKLLYSRDQNTHPVLIYMSDEIIGEYALKETTLRSLGLTGGRTIIRHMFRTVLPAVLNEVQEGIDREKARQAKLAARVAEMESVEMSTSVSNVAPDSMAGPSHVEQPMDVEHPLPAQSNVELAMDYNQGTFQNQPSNVSMNSNLVQSFIFGTYDQQEHDTRTRPLRETQPSPFVNFKFPEETKGKDVYHNEFSDVNRQEYQPCDRESLVYSLDEETPFNIELDDPPEKFFEVTETDARILYRDLQKSLVAMTEQPLMTQSMRKADLEAKYARYSKVIIRIQFPDRLVLQGVFRARETVFAIHKYVKECIENKNQEFELYTTPPKTILVDQAETLIEANLAPMTLIYFGSLSQTSPPAQFLSNEMLGKLASRVDAEKIVTQNMPLPTASPSEASFEIAGPSRTRPSANQGHQDSSEPGARPLPKWFTSGKK